MLEEYPTLFYSQALNAAQRNYSTYEGELLAVVKACTTFSVYLLGRDFNLQPEHAALSAILNSALRSTSRVANSLLDGEHFLFSANHSQGVKNVAAEKLARIPWPVLMPKTVQIVQLAV